MDDFAPDPANYTMKRPPQPLAQKSIDQPIDEQTLSRLDSMTKDELITLIKRISGAMWGIGLMDDTAIADALRLKAAHAGLTEKDILKALPSMNLWFDRTLGKPSQSIQMDATLKQIVVNATIRFADELPVIDNDLKTIDHKIE